jgi:hypothetical protein
MQIRSRRGEVDYVAAMLAVNPETRCSADYPKPLWLMDNPLRAPRRVLTANSPNADHQTYK